MKMIAKQERINVTNFTFSDFQNNLVKEKYSLEILTLNSLIYATMHINNHITCNPTVKLKRMSILMSIFYMFYCIS